MLYLKACGHKSSIFAVELKGSRSLPRKYNAWTSAPSSGLVQSQKLQIWLSARRRSKRSGQASSWAPASPRAIAGAAGGRCLFQLLWGPAAGRFLRRAQRAEKAFPCLARAIRATKRSLRRSAGRGLLNGHCRRQWRLHAGMQRGGRGSSCRIAQPQPSVARGQHPGPVEAQAVVRPRKNAAWP